MTTDQREEALRLAKESGFIQEYSGRLVCHLPNVEHLIALARASTAPQEPLYVIFDGPCSHESGRFVEVENERGQSVRVGEWQMLPDGLWSLGPVYANPQPQAAPQEPVACALRKYTQSEADDNSEIWLVQLSPGQTLTEDQLLSYRAWKSVQEVPAATPQPQAAPQAPNAQDK